MKNAKYNLSEKVFHVTPESDQGTVLDARYSMFYDKWEYLVTFTPNVESLWYFEHELSTSKTFS